MRWLVSMGIPVFEAKTPPPWMLDLLTRLDIRLAHAVVRDSAPVNLRPIIADTFVGLDPRPDDPNAYATLREDSRIVALNLACALAVLGFAAIQVNYFNDYRAFKLPLMRNQPKKVATTLTEVLAWEAEFVDRFIERGQFSSNLEVTIGLVKEALKKGVQLPRDYDVRLRAASDDATHLMNTYLMSTWFIVGHEMGHHLLGHLDSGIEPVGRAALTDWRRENGLKPLVGGNERQDEELDADHMGLYLSQGRVKQPEQLPRVASAAACALAALAVVSASGGDRLRDVEPSGLDTHPPFLFRIKAVGLATATLGARYQSTYYDEDLGRSVTFNPGVAVSPIFSCALFLEKMGMV